MANAISMQLHMPSPKSRRTDHKMKGKDRPLRKAVTIVIILAIALAMPVAQAYATLQVTLGTTSSTSATTTSTTSTPSFSLPWSANFESGSQNTYFNAPNQQNISPGNNPGQVVTSLVHSSKYAGYYYITSNPTTGWVRDYWSMDWSGHQPTTHDLLAVAWVYVPTQTMTGPVSFITIGFDGYTPITVDIDRQTLPHMYLKLWNSIFTDANAYQPNPKVEFPFDKWVKLALEIHYKPAAEISNVILYQDDVKIIDFQTHALDAQPKNLLTMHFGLYVGNGQGAFKVYNDDLSLTDLSGVTTTTTSSTSTSPTTSSTTTTSSTSTSPTTSSTTSSTSSSTAGGNTVLLLHMDTSFLDSSASNHAVTANGNAKIVTAYSKFGGGSGSFDGTNSYLTTPDSADWYFGTRDFTIDFWVRFNALPTSGSTVVIVSQYTDNNNYWLLRLQNSATYNWSFYVSVAGSTTISISEASPGLSVGTWYHIALVRSGNNFYFFQAGTRCGTTGSSSNEVPNLSGVLRIGAGFPGGYPSLYFNGCLDEFRISNGVAVWTSNFTPPTHPYS